MFCPEDGTKIEPERHFGITTYYPACSLCNTRWVYDGEAGTYIVDNFEEKEGVCPVCSIAYRSHFRGEVCEPVTEGEPQ